jgi:tetratricopeptide (TPR) repeat protein
MATDQSPDEAEPVEQEAVTEWAPLTAGQRRRLQKCFEHGNQMADQDKYDFDYAHDMYGECAAKDPGNLVYVEAMFDNLHRKFKNVKKAKSSGFNARTAKKLLDNREWKEVFQQGIAGLRSNPRDVPTLRALAQACEALGLNEVELRYLKNAQEAKPQNIDVNKHCARSLGRMGLYDQAIACWHRVESIDKKDADATKMISQLTIEKARATVSDEEPKQETPAASTKPAAASAAQPEAKPAEPAPRREITLTRRQVLEQDIVAEPDQVAPYLELADILIADGRSGEAEQVVTRALNASPGDFNVQTKLEDVRIFKAKQHIAIAEKQAKTDDTDQARELVTGLRDDLNRMELEVYTGRSEREPSNLKLKLDLGVRLKRSGNYTEAVVCLKEARSSEEHKSLATLELGECCQQLRQYKQAMECYRRTIELTSDSTGETRKLALYRAGVLAAGMKDLGPAEMYLEELVGMNARYRDAAGRLDKIRLIRHKG